MLLLFLLAAASAGLPSFPPTASQDAARPATGNGTAPHSIFAVESPEFVAALGPLRPKIGSWAEYLVRSSGEEDVRVRLSLLPPALEGGRAWLEVTTLGAQTLPFAARLLLRGPGQLERALVYALGQAPIEVPLDDLRPVDSKPKPHRAAVRATSAGRVKVTVPAGTFQAEELRVVSGGQTTRVWRAAHVPLWGLVRAEGPGQIVELIGHGEQGAHSVFPADQGKGNETAR